MDKQEKTDKQIADKLKKKDRQYKARQYGKE